MSESQLLDILLPTQQEHGPLAIGWYLVIIAILIALGVGLYLGWRHWQRGKAKRLSLQALAQLEAAQGSAAELNQLLKRAALAYFPRNQVAALAGQEWLNFLDQHFTGKQSFSSQQQAWESALFQGQGKASAEMFEMSRDWLNKALPPKQ